MRQVLLLISLLLQFCNAVDIPLVDSKARDPVNGQVCGFGDMNKDRYTDLIVQDQEAKTLTIYTQSENGKFKSGEFKPIKFNIPSSGVVCAVADFNGDALPDIMVTTDSVRDSAKEVHVFLNNDNVFTTMDLDIEHLIQPPNIVDLNGDGIADIVGFLHSGEFFCYQFHASGKGVRCEDASFPGHAVIRNPYGQFPHIFADITGDLSAEIIFALDDESGEKVEFQTWQIESISGDVGKWKQVDIIPVIPKPKDTHFGSGVVADFDGDGMIDLLVPVCRHKECSAVEYIAIFSPGKGWVVFQLDLKEGALVPSPDGTIFRVGDFTLDGYPDLIATIKNRNTITPVVLENVDYNGSINFTRKFEIMGPPKNPSFVMPKDMAKGKLKMAAFFDLKEDGSLDILVEYLDYSLRLKFDFIDCDDKGDTTFLKVQIFTNVCEKNCKNSKAGELGSGISWHGTCASYTMPDTSGRVMHSCQCQLPQTSQRALHNPSLLFGLGRSPNFIDELRIGSPRVRETNNNNGNQHTLVKQIVPNSRIIVIPPVGNGTHWQTRLYLTPSQLIIQSLAVLFCTCVFLVILIMFLHHQEKKQDKRERQAQLNRFHFDAM